MNFLAHPLYAILALVSCAWLSYANNRGMSLAHSANPVNWTNGSGGYHGTSFGHGFSHMSHK